MANPLLGLLGLGTAPAQPSPFAPPAIGRGEMFPPQARPFMPPGGAQFKPMPAPMPSPFVGYSRKERRQQQKLPPISPLGPGGPTAQKLGLGGL